MHLGNPRNSFSEGSFGSNKRRDVWKFHSTSRNLSIIGNVLQDPSQWLGWDVQYWHSYSESANCLHNEWVLDSPGTIKWIQGHFCSSHATLCYSSWVSPPHQSCPRQLKGPFKPSCLRASPPINQFCVLHFKIYYIHPNGFSYLHEQLCKRTVIF